MKSRRKYNPSLSFIKHDWEGNKIDEKGRYCNLHEKSEKGFADLFAWQLKGNQFRKMKVGQKTNVMVHPFKRSLSELSDYCSLWLGHATFIYIIEGCKLITDPVLFNITPLKRYTSLPLDTESLVDLDLILLSHNHRDHLDEKSIKLLARQNPEAIIYTGLGIGELLLSWSIKNKIIEAGWYQQFPILRNIKITYLPAKHWNRRYLTDLNTMLWGSFMISSPELHIYFAGDSGIDMHFEEIGNLFPSIDYAFIGIGAYEPNWFMQPSHTNPSEAVKCAKMLNCKQWIPMHYGTFDLSDEPIYLPKVSLIDIPNNHARVVDIGEVMELQYSR